MATFGQFYEMGPFFSGGNLAAGAKIYHYTAGTNTLLNVYTGRDKATASAQPVVCDSQGIASFYGDGIYKLVVATAANTADPPNDVLYTFDNVNLTDGSQSLVGKGANISSASTLVLGTDGDEFVVTGAVTINLISGTQTTVKLVFASTPTLTYSGNLILAGGVSVTVAANDVFYFANEGLSGGNYIWREVGRANVFSSSTTVPWSTGDVKLTLKTVADSTWVLMDDKTIGDASSSATGRANADTSALFTLLWTNVIDTWAPVSSGRGASAAADFAAHKTITLPKTLGRALAGYGTGTVVASGVDADVDTGAANSLTVASNNTKWITGMAVVFTLASGTITGLSSSSTYYVIRSSSTLIKLASTLALAQAGTEIDLTAKSSPVWTITHTYTARVLGEAVGEQSHAMSSTELMAHTHNIVCAGDTIGAGGSIMNGYEANPPTASTADSSGGNAAMNIIQPSIYLNVMIKL